LIPREPGTLCARGMLLTDLSSDYVRSHFADASDESWTQVLALFAAMTEEGHAWLDREGVARAQRRFKRVLDARYRGQNFEVKVDCDGLDRAALPALIERFHAAHKLAYGYAIATRDVELVSARLQAIGTVPKAPQPKVTGGVQLADALLATRPLYVDARQGWREAAVYQRERLPVGVAVAGPAVVNEMSATTIVLPGQSATVDPWGNIVLVVA
jgi:N-methylhydantoinase A